MVGPEGKEPDRAPRRADARRDRPGRQRRGHRARDDEGRDRPRASSRSTAGCGPRSRTSTRSATSSAACGSPTRPPTRGSSRPTRSPATRTSTTIDYIEAAAGDLLPAGDRVDRPDRGSSARSAGLPIKIGKVPFQAIAKAIIGGEYEGFAKVIANAETDDTLGVHIIGPHATDLIAEASLGVRARGDAVGDRRRDPRAPDALARSSARPRWPSTDGRSTSSAGEAGHGAGARRRPDQQRWRSPAAATRTSAPSLGLSDADLLEMYRYVALARAVDERMWILNRAGRIPFVISGQGHEGAQVGDRLGARARARTGSPRSTARSRPA